MIKKFKILWLDEMKCELVAKGDNFVIISVLIGRKTFNIASCYLPPDRDRAIKTLQDLSIHRDLPNMVIGGDFNCTEDDSNQNVVGGKSSSLL